jgi:hypothetical protein
VCLHFANLTGAGSSYQHMGSESGLRFEGGRVWAWIGVSCKTIVSTRSCIVRHHAPRFTTSQSSYPVEASRICGYGRVFARLLALLHTATNRPNAGKSMLYDEHQTTDAQ